MFLLEFIYNGLLIISLLMGLAMSLAQSIFMQQILEDKNLQEDTFNFI